MKLITQLVIRQPLYSKARPRVARGHAFMPKAYMDKRKAMLAAIKEQYSGEPLEGPLRVEVDVEGEGRGDLDNVAGALFDCANGVLWTDDRVSIISELEIKWKKAKKADSVWVVRIYEV